MHLIDFLLLLIIVSPFLLFLIYIEWMCYLELIKKIILSFKVYLDNRPFITVTRVLDSVEDAKNYIGKEVKHNPVEMPSTIGILTSISVDGYCTIGQYHIAPYWQIRVCDYIFINKLKQ